MRVDVFKKQEPGGGLKEFGLWNGGRGRLGLGS